MADLSKTDIKEVVVSALEPFAQAIAKDFKDIKEDLSFVKSELRGGFASVNERLTSVESDVKLMKTNSGEIFTKLDGFVTLYKNQEERMEIFSKQTATFEGRLSVVEKRVGI